MLHHCAYYLELIIEPDILCYFHILQHACMYMEIEWENSGFALGVIHCEQVVVGSVSWMLHRCCIVLECM